MKFFVFLFLLQPSLKLWAEPTLVVRAPNVTATEFISFCRSQHDIICYSEHYLKSRQGLSTELNSLIEKAQTEFLNGALLEAKSSFQNLIEKLPAGDWSEEQRKILAYSFLRLAQMSENSAEISRLSRQAAQLGEIKLDPNLFPPPLWQQYQSKIKQRKTQSLPLDLWFKNARYLLVDGLPIELTPDQQIISDEWPHYFTLVYDHAPPVSRELTWAELKLWRPEPLPFITGTCEDFVIRQEPLQNQSTKIYFSTTCLKDFTKPMVTTEIDFKGLNNFDPKKEGLSEWWRKPWVWAMAGTLVAGAVYLNNQKEKNQEDPPTKTVGF